MQKELVLDTNVPSILVKKYRDVLPKVEAAMNRNFRLVVSPQTFVELVKPFCVDNTEYFASDKLRIQLIIGRKAIKVLQYPADFALQAVLSIPPRQLDLPRQMSDRIRIILRAKSSAELLYSGVWLPSYGKKKKGRLDPAALSAEIESIKRDQLTLLDNVRRGLSFPSSPQEYARALAVHLRRVLTEHETMLLGDALRAIYGHQRSIYQQMRDDAYNASNLVNDWFDGAQLFYLADPNVYLLTDDQKMHARVGQTAQAHQVILFNTFLTECSLPGSG